MADYVPGVDGLDSGDWPIRASHDGMLAQLQPVSGDDGITLTLSDGVMCFSMIFTDEQLERVEGAIKSTRRQRAHER